MERYVTRVLAGIFVGGAGARMAGLAKGLMLTADGTTVVERWRTMLDRLELPVVLVGERKEYGALGIEVVADQPPGIGPLGGLVGLLRRADGARVLALACDMPFVSATIVERLLAQSPQAPIVAPRRDGRWEPLCARYEPRRVLPVAEAIATTSDRSLQRLLTDVGAAELQLSSSESDELRDWDSPGDVGPT
jgi:molybdopterin-guanine dinucleotide biosynthesis protein A